MACFAYKTIVVGDIFNTSPCQLFGKLHKYVMSIVCETVTDNHHVAFIQISRDENTKHMVT
jgi:hypothetical protein